MCPGLWIIVHLFSRSPETPGSSSKGRAHMCWGTPFSNRIAIARHGLARLAGARRKSLIITSLKLYNKVLEGTVSRVGLCPVCPGYFGAPRFTAPRAYLGDTRGYRSRSHGPGPARPELGYWPWAPRDRDGRTRQGMTRRTKLRKRDKHDTDTDHRIRLPGGRFGKGSTSPAPGTSSPPGDMWS
jgi:hypothetical protein